MGGTTRNEATDVVQADRNSAASGKSEYWDTREAAEFLKLSPRTLERMRVEGCGPRFLKAGKSIRAKVLYRPMDVREWVEAISYESTSEYGGN